MGQHITRTSYDYKQIIASDTGHESVSVVVAQDAAAAADMEAGTVLGRITATGEYAPYDDTAGDGTEVARGILKTPISQDDLIAGTNDAAMYYRGAFLTDKLVGMDAAGLVDLYAREIIAGTNITVL